ncbi:MAG: hypothetical protein ACMXX5_01995 [Candidatus Woesearchaeota archaeon]
MNKKAEVEHTFTILIIVVVTIFLLIFGTIFIRNMITTIHDSELADFSKALEENIKQMSMSRGSRTYTYEMPSRVSKIILVDTTNRRALLRNDIIKENPLLYDSIDSGHHNNMFLFSSNGDLIRSSYIGDISLGQFGDQICTGIAVIDDIRSRLEIMMTSRPGMDVILGEDCEGLNYVAFQGPFSQDIITDMDRFPHIELTGNRRQISLRKDEIRMVDYQALYFSNGSINSTPFNLNSYAGQKVDRIFFSTDTPGDTDALFRMGFRNNIGQWHFYGPNLTASSDDIDYYYSYPGQYITLPGFNYTQVKVEIHLFSSEDNLRTPIFHWLRLSYFE